MNVPERPPAVLLPFPAPGARRGQQGNVLAVVGGLVDAAVVDLALVLAQDGHRQVDLLLLVEVPPALPMRAYGEWLLAQGGDAPLETAEQSCGAAVAESALLLCRGSGPALVAEVVARRSTDLVLGAAVGGWWQRLRLRRAIAHVQARARCRVYVVHVPPPPSERELPRVAAR
jgi:hypothetical protein